MSIYNPGAGFKTKSRTFGRRKHPITGKVTGHKGDDWPAPQGTPIPAAYDGIVQAVAFQYNEEKKTGWGHYVVLSHNVNGKTVQTRYAHMPQRSHLAQGASIKQGESVGQVGSSGGSTGPHLHFEIIVDGTHVDPSTYDWPVAATGWVYPFPAPLTKPQAKNNTKAEVKPASARALRESDLYFGEPANRLGALGRSESGFYPVGVNSLWHGGIHFDAATNAVLHQKAGIRCIYDGEVVAYLVDTKYPEADFNPGPRKAAYSTGFTLVRHKLVLPEQKPAAQKPAPEPAKTAPAKTALARPPPPAKLAPAKLAPAKPADAKQDEVKKENTLVFYSLYMHQLDFKGYEDDRQLQRPRHWDASKKFKVGDKAKDQQAVDAPGWDAAAASPPDFDLLFADTTDGGCSIDPDDDDNTMC
jgi:murein DD-endopeptidase MepM/ murein hydrolase activator NlpD